jgi:hypothetical protein
VNYFDADGRCKENVTGTFDPLAPYWIPSNKGTYLGDGIWAPPGSKIEPIGPNGTFNESSIWTGVGDAALTGGQEYIIGLANGFYDGITGAVVAVLNPVGTIIQATDGMGTFVGNVIYNPSGLATDVVNGVVDTVSDPRKIGHVVGGVVAAVVIAQVVPAKGAAVEQKAPVWPKTAEEMNSFLKVEGKAIPDTVRTPGRNKTVWDLGESKITLEQHPYDAPAPAYHTDPHWHLDTPNLDHARFLPGDSIPGF